MPGDAYYRILLGNVDIDTMVNPCGANISLAARKIMYLSTLGAMCSVVLIQSRYVQYIIFLPRLLCLFFYGNTLFSQVHVGVLAVCFAAVLSVLLYITVSMCTFVDTAMYLHC